MTTGLLILCLVILLLAVAPAWCFLMNLRLYAPPPAEAIMGAFPRVSVLIPARNEEATIGAAVESALACRGVHLEVVVLDDDSTDATREVVERIAERDDRVRIAGAPPLPAGWCGKQHACWVLAGLARHPILVFIDADVRLEPDSLGRMAAFLASSAADLASGIPRQETKSLLESSVLPLVHFILLGFLPMGRMRIDRHPRFAAGCGQLFVTTRRGYVASGGHAAIPATRHDGIKLPRAYRAAGLATDLFDATDLATCRMYTSSNALVLGLAKNAREGLAAPGLIMPMSIILLGGQVLPFVFLALAWRGWPVPWPGLCLPILVFASATALLPRFLAAVRFRQSYVGIFLHPLGVLILVAIQWYAFARERLGRPVSWKGRIDDGADENGAVARTGSCMSSETGTTPPPIHR